jgi:hypothetical protein
MQYKELTDFIVSAVDAPGDDATADAIAYATSFAAMRVHKVADFNYFKGIDLVGEHRVAVCESASVYACCARACPTVFDGISFCVRCVCMCVRACVCVSV